MITDTIKPYELTAKKQGPHLLISAGVHGDEFEPMLAAQELTRMINLILIAGKVTIVPVVNMSANNIGARCGADDLDLARICPGNNAGSISEVFAAQISKLITQADYYIDMHTGGNLFAIYPLTGYMLHSSPEVLQQQQKMAKAFNLPVIWGTDSAPNGRTLSVARDANIPAIYVEYGGGGSVNQRIIKAYTGGCINVLKSLRMVDPTKKAQLVKRYWVEDFIPHSGHLQSKMPAPVEGIFSPAVKLGEAVKKKQLWGKIIDPVTGDKKEILAEEKGIVLFLRVSARVKSGDSLGGILPISKYGKKMISKQVNQHK